MNVHECTQMCMNECVYVCTHACTYACSYVRMYPRFYVCMSESMYEKIQRAPLFRVEWSYVCTLVTVTAGLSFGALFCVRDCRTRHVRKLARRATPNPTGDVTRPVHRHSLPFWCLAAVGPEPCSHPPRQSEKRRQTQSLRQSRLV